MVYKEDGSDIPGAIKERIKGKENRDVLARQWAAVWNSVYGRTKDETIAYSTASGILKDRLNQELFSKMTNYCKK